MLETIMENPTPPIADEARHILVVDDDTRKRDDAEQRHEAEG